MSLPDLTFYTPTGYSKPVSVTVDGTLKNDAPVSWADELYSYFYFYVKNNSCSRSSDA